MKSKRNFIQIEFQGTLKFVLNSMIFHRNGILRNFENGMKLYGVL